MPLGPSARLDTSADGAIVDPACPLDTKTLGMKMSDLSLVPRAPGQAGVIYEMPPLAYDFYISLRFGPTGFFMAPCSSFEGVAD